MVYRARGYCNRSCHGLEFTWPCLRRACSAPIAPHLPQPCKISSNGGTDLGVTYVSDVFGCYWPQDALSARFAACRGGNKRPSCTSCRTRPCASHVPDAIAHVHGPSMMSMRTMKTSRQLLAAASLSALDLSLIVVAKENRIIFLARRPSQRAQK